MEDNKEFVPVSSASLKLTKTTKGYTWEIKILELDVDKLEELNNKMLERFGPNDL